MFTAFLSGCTQILFPSVIQNERKYVPLIISSDWPPPSCPQERNTWGIFFKAQNCRAKCGHPRQWPNFHSRDEVLKSGLRHWLKQNNHAIWISSGHKQEFSGTIHLFWDSRTIFTSWTAEGAGYWWLVSILPLFRKQEEFLASKNVSEKKGGENICWNKCFRKNSWQRINLLRPGTTTYEESLRVTTSSK